MTLRKLVIKKIAFGIALLALILCASSCKQNPDTQKDDNSKKTVVTSPEGFGFVFIEETTEKLDGKDYVVKAYADSYGAPYLYDYYKYYYLDGKLKKIHVYYHNRGQADYTYKEFKNYIEKAQDFGKYEEQIFTFYDTGRLKEREDWVLNDPSYELGLEHTLTGYYDVEGNPIRLIKFFYDNGYNDNIYYKNGKNGLSYYFEYDHGEETFDFNFYYESGFAFYVYNSSRGKLRTYEDGVYSRDDDIGSEDDYTTEEAYTQEQAIALCNQLIQQYFN
jgi:hypothetical protein